MIFGYYFALVIFVICIDFVLEVLVYEYYCLYYGTDNYFTREYYIYIKYISIVDNETNKSIINKYGKSKNNKARKSDSESESESESED